ncbi:MAG: methylmalonyl-CoA epimerase [Anaerolineae bacterium]|nr:methylmalonyl-CoA epimerase [Anaerolineae bacterium]
MIKINHIAIVVSDLEVARKFWNESLGLPLERVAHVGDEAVNVAFLPAGEGEIELVQPTDPESGVARYLEKRGPGIHHLCLEVDDLTATMARLRAAGVELINEEPRVSAEGRQYAFVHPRSTGGVLLELYARARAGGIAAKE